MLNNRPLFENSHVYVASLTTRSHQVILNQVSTQWIVKCLIVKILIINYDKIMSLCCRKYYKQYNNIKCHLKHLRTHEKFGSRLTFMILYTKCISSGQSGHYFSLWIIFYCNGENLFGT